MPSERTTTNGFLSGSEWLSNRVAGMVVYNAEVGCDDSLTDFAGLGEDRGSSPAVTS